MLLQQRSPPAAEGLVGRALGWVLASGKPLQLCKNSGGPAACLLHGRGSQCKPPLPPPRTQTRVLRSAAFPCRPSVELCQVTHSPNAGSLPSYFSEYNPWVMGYMGLGRTKGRNALWHSSTTMDALIVSIHHHFFILCLLYFPRDGISYFSFMIVLLHIQFNFIPRVK